jgi:hypothetical protein
MADITKTYAVGNQIITETYYGSGQRYTYTGDNPLLAGNNLTRDQVSARLGHVGWERVPDKEVSMQVPSERCKLAYWADKVGYVPLIGTVVGVGRIVCSVVMAIFSLLSALATALVCRCDLAKKCLYVVTRSVDEGVRGFVELIPFCSWLSDKQKDKWEKQEGRITEHRGAYGRYVYESPPVHGWIVYSQDKHEGSILWKSRLIGSEVHGINGFFEKP